VREGLASGALKLSALHLSPMDYFENYIFETADKIASVALSIASVH